MNPSSPAVKGVTLPGAGKYWVPFVDANDPDQEVIRDDIKVMRYRSGRSPHYNMTIRGVSREDERTFRAAAKEHHMTLSVFWHFLAEAMREHRMLLLPVGYDIEALISDSLARRIQDAVDAGLRAELADAGLADPYRK